MNVTILNEKKVFDGFFKVIEGEIKHERFDETIKRLCLERGDIGKQLFQLKTK